AEVRGSERQTPGCVEGALGRDSPEQLPARVEHVEEAGPRAGDVVRLALVGLRKGDEDRAVDVLDTERRKAVRDLLVDERSRGGHQGERSVEDVDAAVVEVGRIERVPRDRQALEDYTHPA